MSLSALDLAKKKLEIGRVKQARSEMEYEILVKESEIERLQANIEIQKKREQELTKEIGGENV